MSSYQRKPLWLTASRAPALTVLLGSSMAMKMSSPETLPVDTDALLVMMVVTYAFTMAYALMLKRTAPLRWVTDVQLALDAVAVSAIVYLTGGINSYFSSLYS